MVLIQVIFNDANELDPNTQMLQFFVLQQVYRDLPFDILAVLYQKIFIAILNSITYHEDGRFVRLTVSIGLCGVFSPLNFGQFHVDLAGRPSAHRIKQFTLQTHNM